MDRRRFRLTSLAGALTEPHAAEPQQPKKTPRIGYLGVNRPEEVVGFLASRE